MEPRYKGPVIIYVEVGEGKRRGVKAISDWLEVGGGAKDYSYVGRKQEGTNKWYCIASLLKASCSHRQDLTKISSFVP